MSTPVKLRSTFTRSNPPNESVNSVSKKPITGSNLKNVCVRLPISMIDELKQCGAAEGIGYQPLMRQLLLRYLKAKKEGRDTIFV